MKRELIPGIWGRCGRAIPDAQVSEMDNVVPLRDEFPMPSDERTEEDDAFRAAFWQSYVAALILAAVCVVILAVWPL